MDSILRLWHFNTCHTINECRTLKVNNLISLKYLFYYNCPSLPYLFLNIKTPCCMKLFMFSCLFIQDDLLISNAFWPKQKTPPLSLSSLLTCCLILETPIFFGFLNFLPMTPVPHHLTFINFLSTFFF